MTAAARFEQLYATHATCIRRLVASRMATCMVDDVCQDVWLRIWRELVARPDRKVTRTWLHTIVIDVCRRHCRNNSTRWHCIPLAEHHHLAHREQIDTARHLELEWLILHLPSAQQQVIRLHYVHGHTIQEIAAQLGLPIGTVKSHLSRARRKMKELAKK